MVKKYFFVYDLWTKNGENIILKLTYKTRLIGSQKKSLKTFKGSGYASILFFLSRVLKKKWRFCFTFGQISKILVTKKTSKDFLFLCLWHLKKRQFGIFFQKKSLCCFCGKVTMKQFFFFQNHIQKPISIEKLKMYAMHSLSKKMSSSGNKLSS